ncbi:hypothetical protein HF086_011732 [Spodoptera exigua]|uniref:Transposase Tc1-like domain-containing protein n=1 Tax=Spodoptera exigua TaxID=7107 RepID=A0A922MHG8_SPOEX|nr:hypothetical protein HF086_011732 [Spodoptera exigua]
MSTRKLNQEERNQIIILHGQGLNIYQIAVELNLQRTTVRRWVRRYEEEGSLTERVRAPRRRAINEEQLHNMIVSYQESPFTPTRSFAQEYEVSMQTIRNELHRAGVHHRRPAKKIIFTQEQKAARVRFAREYRDFDFTYAIFSDEKCFRSS